MILNTLHLIAIELIEEVGKYNLVVKTDQIRFQHRSRHIILSKKGALYKLVIQPTDGFPVTYHETDGDWIKQMIKRNLI